MKCMAVAVSTLIVSMLMLTGSLGAEPLFKADESRPADAAALFDGKDLSEWQEQGSSEPAGWQVENEYMEVKPGAGNICTKQEFGDCQLHVEFWLPLMANAKGQGRANSGVYVQGRYEVQVLDSYGLKSDSNDCGAIYGVAAPLVNACRPPEQWQTYDIFFRAPRFDADGKQISRARMSVLHNGVWIHDNVEIPGVTTAAMSGDLVATGPIMLQDHGNRIRYRNIWLRPLSPDR